MRKGLTLILAGLVSLNSYAGGDKKPSQDHKKRKQECIKKDISQFEKRSKYADKYLKHCKGDNDVSQAVNELKSSINKMIEFKKNSLESGEENKETYKALYTKIRNSEAKMNASKGAYRYKSDIAELEKREASKGADVDSSEYKKSVKRILELYSGIKTEEDYKSAKDKIDAANLDISKACMNMSRSSELKRLDYDVDKYGVDSAAAAKMKSAIDAYYSAKAAKESARVEYEKAKQQACKSKCDKKNAPNKSKKDKKRISDSVKKW